jgi:hypothetical protein
MGAACEYARPKCQASACGRKEKPSERKESACYRLRGRNGSRCYANRSNSKQTGDREVFQTVINVLAAVGLVALAGSCLFLACALWMSGREGEKEDRRLQALGEMPPGWQHREIPDAKAGRDRAPR